MITTLFSSVTLLVGWETSEGAIKENNYFEYNNNYCALYQELECNASCLPVCSVRTSAMVEFGPIPTLVLADRNTPTN